MQKKHVFFTLRKTRVLYAEKLQKVYGQSKLQGIFCRPEAKGVKSKICEKGISYTWGMISRAHFMLVKAITPTFQALTPCRIALFSTQF